MAELLMSEREENGKVIRTVCNIPEDWPLADEWLNVLVAIMESGHQATYDLCGEQREWHLPRIQKVMLFLMQQFPALVLTAMEKAKDPYGDLLFKEDR